MILRGLDGLLRRQFNRRSVTVGRWRVAYFSRRAPVRVAVFGAVAVAAFLIGCGETVNKVTANAPAVAQLAIPDLLEPTVNRNGVAHYDLTISKSRHDYRQTVLTDTYSYNGMSVLGPTLRLRTGSSVAISVTNQIDETTTTHWHGADVPAEDDGGPHSLIEPGETWVADFDVIQPAATLWYHPHAHGSTAEHVYRGAAGLIIIEDDNPAAAALPTTYGVDDIRSSSRTGTSPRTDNSISPSIRATTETYTPR